MLCSKEVPLCKKQRAIVSEGGISDASSSYCVVVHATYGDILLRYTFSSCSNIALKLNTKLMNVCNQGRAWTTDCAGRVGAVEWIYEVPTMVIGVDVSHGKDCHCHFSIFSTLTS